MSHKIAVSRAALGALLGLFTVAGAAQAQSAAAPGTFHVCYVPGSGTMYRVKAEGAPQACTSAEHVEFSWGAVAQPLAGSPSAKQIDHGTLTGLLDDDHSQYLLADGVRATVNGFAVTGTAFTGTIPVSGPGTRLMWFPNKAALRAGKIFQDQWDEANIGEGSVALGRQVKASEYGAVALGSSASATGQHSIAMGSDIFASGNAAVALGMQSNASGNGAVAIGGGAIASGDNSMALGWRSDTNNKIGSFVYGDRTTLQWVQAAADNQFAVRAQSFWFGTNNYVTATPGRFIETSTGAYLSTGGTWTNSSDVNRKTAFLGVDGEQVLKKLAAMPITSWSYRDEDASVRHIGPTAQDFHATFGLGASETGIATVDADGVALAAAKALEKRTATNARQIDALQALVTGQRQEIDTLRRQVGEQAALLESLRVRLEHIERQPTR